MPGLAANPMNNMEYNPKRTTVHQHVLLSEGGAGTPSSHQSRQQSILNQQSFNPTSILKDIVEPVFDTDPDFMANGESVRLRLEAVQKSKT